MEAVGMAWEAPHERWPELPLECKGDRAALRGHPPPREGLRCSGSHLLASVWGSPAGLAYGGTGRSWPLRPDCGSASPPQGWSFRL